MPSEGPLSPTATTVNAAVGSVNWTNASNVLASDDSYATAVIATQQTYYLKARAFPFTFPRASTIDGIKAEVEIKAIVGGTLDVVKLSKQNTVQAANRGGSTFTASDAYYTFGSATDLWGTTWSPYDLYDPLFGVYISIGSGLDQTDTISVDHIRVTVYYTPRSDLAVLGRGRGRRYWAGWKPEPRGLWAPREARALLVAA